MNFAIVGCGFISDSYLTTLEQHAGLNCVGVYDHIQARSEVLSSRFRLHCYHSLDDLLQDESVGFVINLTNPRDHYSVSKSCLLSGKHVYTEKPLGMNLDEGAELIELADSKNLSLGVAPCSVLSPCAQLLWKQIRDNRIGKVRLIYANFDDGYIAPYESPWGWQNSLGVNWPAKDEFEVGCTFEHAGYFLTWLCSIFGPATKVSSFASTLVPDKGIAVDSMAPDFTCGCIEFKDGIVARATCGLVAPRDKSLTIVGDDGYLLVENLRDDYGSIHYYPRVEPKTHKRIQNASKRFLSWLPSFVFRKLSSPYKEVIRVDSNYPSLSRAADKRVDFLRGPAEFADAIKQSKKSRLSGDMGLHVVEIINALHRENGPLVQLRTTFKEPEPLLYL